MADVRELVREDAFQLGRETPQRAALSRLRSPRPAARGRQRGRAENRPAIRYSRGLTTPARAASDSTVEWSGRRLTREQLAGADHPERDPVGVGPEPDGCKQDAEDEERGDAQPAERPADAAEHRARGLAGASTP